MGLMLGMELLNQNGQPDGERAISIIKRALRDGLLLLADSPTANVLSFTPPFDISDDEIAFLAKWLRAALQ
jgi:4-aminobutyrate aminotransferase-like enzyme